MSVAIPCTNQNIYSNHSVYPLTNEVGQRETQEGVTKLLAGLEGETAMVGTSGLFIINLASCTSIKHLAIFDISTRVQKFWERIGPIIGRANNAADARNEIHSSLAIYRDEFFSEEDQSLVNAYQRNFDSEILSGLSFLSSQARFEKIKRIFSTGAFSFHRIDFLDSEAFRGVFEDLGKRGIQTKLVYVSNISSVTQDGIEEYRKIEKSLRTIPEGAIIVDAHMKSGRYVQRLHENYVPAMLAPRFSVLEDALRRNEFETLAVQSEIEDSSGFTPMMTAAERGNLQLVQALVGSKASVEHRSSIGDTPLFYADSPDIIQYLVNQRANINIRDQQGMTPLHQAVYRGSVLAIQTLIETRADPNMTDDYGYTPRNIISLSDYSEQPEIVNGVLRALNTDRPS